MSDDDYWFNQRVDDAMFETRLQAAKKHLHALVAQWHNTEPEDGYGTSLHEFLGMTWDEYRAWTRDANDIPARFLEHGSNP